MSRTVYLIAIAMAMFTGGVVVVVFADGKADHVLGAVAILGAIAVVLANVNGKR